MAKVVEGMTAEEASLAREQRLSGDHDIPVDMPAVTQIVEGMTAEEAEAARTTRLQ